jgi:glycosyltransferase involved in cell wall biosynthesis
MIPKVSVVVATRDRPEMVREAIESILAQDFDGDIEVIVVADQSEPDVDLTRTDADRTVRVIRNVRSGGLAGARNTGIEAASGAFVAFCDDDDYWLPGKLARQVDLLVQVPEAALCTCGIEVQFDDQSYPRVLHQDRVEYDELLEDRHTELHPSTFVLRRRAVLDHVGLVDEGVPGGFGEDYDYLLRAARFHPVLNVPEPLTVVRWGKQSFFFRRWETMAAGLTWVLERYPDFERSAVGSARIRGQIGFAHAAMGHRRQAFKWATQAARRNPREPRVLLTLAVASKAFSPDFVMEQLHKRGRGI